jgi:hypothetical protein
MALTAPDAQTLIRKIYAAEGLDRTRATVAERYAAQRRYSIARKGNVYVAERKQ